MSEQLLEKVRRLELSNRRWKAATLVMAALFVLSLLWAGGASAVATWRLTAEREEAVMERDRAVQAEVEARRLAERQRAAEQAVRDFVEQNLPQAQPTKPK
jgi:hypothetical protein